MVSPSPDLQRRMRNTDNIVTALKSHLVPSLYTKYPRDYIDTDSLDNLEIKRPWIEPTTVSTIEPISPTQLRSKNILSTSLITGGDDDKPSTVSTTTIYNRFFGTSGKTLRNYYIENSYGKYIPRGNIVGNKWYRIPSPQTYSYYRDDPNTLGCDYGIKSYPHNVQKLFEDVLDLIKNDPSITSEYLSTFDIDGDGHLDRVVIVHAGGEASYGSDCNEMWAVKWGIYPKVVKNKTFSNFMISAEYLNSPNDPQRCGIDCHEFGHILGLPDLYDYSGNTNGVGMWSLMSGGSWGSDYAITPTHLDAWSKQQFTWTSATTNPVGPTYIYDTETNDIVIKYTTLDPREYFLIENRQKIGFDIFLPGSGLLIWHINEDKDQHTEKFCHTVSLMQADGNQDLENIRNNGDLGDPYPGIANKRSFGASTTPGTLLCGILQNGNILDISIDNISDSGSIMSFDSVLSGPVTGSAKFNTTPTGADIYFDTTYKGTTDISTGMLNIDNIPVGTVNYTVKKSGYVDYTGSINISQNTTTYKLVYMTPIISAVDIISDPIVCQQLCNTVIHVTWRNSSTVSWSLYPAIIVDGQRITFNMPEELEIISPGSLLTKSFVLSDMTYGDHTICPDPR